MVIVSFLGAAIYVTFAQGIRIWQSAVKQSLKGQEEFFFEEIKSELRNSFLYKISALNGQSQMIEFNTLAKDLRGSKQGAKTLNVPARIRYRFNSDKKLIQKEITFYEKMLNSKSKLETSRIAIEGVTAFNIEYYQYPTKGASSSWLKQWRNTCFPEAIKLTTEWQSAPGLKDMRIISIPATGECVDEEESGQ